MLLKFHVPKRVPQTADAWLESQSGIKLVGVPGSAEYLDHVTIGDVSGIYSEIPYTLTALAQEQDKGRVEYQYWRVYVVAAHKHSLHRNGHICIY